MPNQAGDQLRAAQTRLSETVLAAIAAFADETHSNVEAVEIVMVEHLGGQFTPVEVIVKVRA